MLRLISLALLLLSAPGASAQDPAVEASAQQPRTAARGKGGLLATVPEIERVLLNRYGASRNGRELLNLLVQAELLEKLAADEGVEIGAVDVSKRWELLDTQARAAGVEGGMIAEIERQGFTPDEFRALLRVSMIQEELARRALGVKPGTPVGGDQQQVWLEQEMAERGLERPAPPWAEGYVARCGDVQVDVDTYAEFLRKRLPRDQITEACWHVLLMKAMEAQMPDLAPEALARAVDFDMARRRREHEAEYPQISYEQRLGASGRTIASLRKDPSVRIAALSRLWVDRTYGAEGLKQTYAAERSYFDGRFGASVRTHMIFLVAGRFANDLVKRTYEDAGAELQEIVRRVGNLDDFAALASQLSEEPKTREKSGELGWITSADLRYPKPLCDAVFEYVNAGGKIPIEGVAVGPVQLDTGSAMLWISGQRESPGWEVMAEHVHEELRRRFMEDVMPRTSMEVEL